MGVPTVASVGTVSAVAAVANTVPLPAGAAAGDILLMIDQRTDTLPTISATGGGTWTSDGSSAGGTCRTTVWWCRNTGSQTNPTITASADHSLAVMIAIRGAVGSGSPMDVASVGYAPNFAETSSPVPSPATLTTLTNQCLIVVVLGSPGPDVDANPATEFSGSNANLNNLTEQLDVTTAQGAGGALCIITGGMLVAGLVGNTTIVHSNFRPSGRVLAIKPAVVDSATSAVATPVFPTAAGPGVVPIVAAAAGAGVVPVRTVGAMAAGVVPVIVTAAGVGVVPTVETP